jgi:hypothetical protein
VESECKSTRAASFISYEVGVKIDHNASRRKVGVSGAAVLLSTPGVRVRGGARTKPSTKYLNMTTVSLGSYGVIKSIER